MNFRKIAGGVGLASIIVSTALLFSSCTPKITEEQMLKLKELYNKEKSLNESITKTQQEKGKVQGELNSRKAELKKCQDDKAFIQDKLSKWPNSWPDYTPEPEPQPDIK